MSLDRMNDMAREVGQSIDLAPGVPDRPSASQAFFANLAAETRKPHFGGMQREWVQALLIRAQEAQLYTPENP